MAVKRYQATRPDGEVITFTSRRDQIFVRFIQLDWDGSWIRSLHSSEQAARTGPNQTPAWNRFQRHIVKAVQLSD